MHPNSETVTDSVWCCLHSILYCETEAMRAEFSISESLMANKLLHYVNVSLSSMADSPSSLDYCTAFLTYLTALLSRMSVRESVCVCVRVRQ
jgi:hypothetical protein